jgi:hypothetical protein
MASVTMIAENLFGKVEAGIGSIPPKVSRGSVDVGSLAEQRVGRGRRGDEEHHERGRGPVLSRASYCCCWQEQGISADHFAGSSANGRSR